MKFGESRVRLKQITDTITILLGPNGSGKSMSLKELEQEINNLHNNGHSFNDTRNPFIRAFNNQYVNVPVYTFTKSKENLVEHHNNFDPFRLSTAFTSEGEQISTSFDTWACEVWLPNLQEHKYMEYWLLLDEIDSGLSYDRLSSLADTLIFILQKELKRGANVHIVLTANSYEFVEAIQQRFHASIIWVPTKRKIEVNSYEKFKKLYLPRYKHLVEVMEEG